MNPITAGSAILFSEPPLNRPHIWYVLTEPEGKPPAVIAVMMQTVKRHTDETVVLQPGDHPFIKHASSVHYSTARRLEVPALLRAMESGRCHLRDSMTPALLARVRQGLIDSPFTVNAVRDYCLPRFKDIRADG